MTSSWSFGRKVGAGFGLVVVFALVMGIVAIVSLRTTVVAKDDVITQQAAFLQRVAMLRYENEQRVAQARGYLLSGDPTFVDDLRRSKERLTTMIDQVKTTADSAELRSLITAIETADFDYRSTIERFVERRSASPTARLAEAFLADMRPKRQTLDERIEAYVAFETKRLDQTQREATDAANRAGTLVSSLALACALLATGLAVVLTRNLSRQIGSAVEHVQSSTAELQAAANQQASSAKEQATSMAEIATTIHELLATSHQIAQSAQQVALIASKTTDAAGHGGAIIREADESLTDIKRQIDYIVTHMVDLGRKSQQIGAVVDLIDELAEQTNILAINAAIEAVGAGEQGRRFGVVADEIRKLADRVGGSTKTIRGLIEEIRTSVNTSVMATETGAKTVDVGNRQFNDLAAAFRDIAELIETTTEAAREIELSTKQQATAVEQVNVAISSTSQATKETEASSVQTFQTASELTRLARDLTRLVQPGAAV